jgi:endonuclease/exonuclease/phosphatase family metal-dependent hydrolase
MRVRAIVWNVHGFRSGLGAVAGVIAKERPELVLLQEARSRRRVRRLAKRLRMEWVSSHRMFNRVRNAVLYSREWRLVSVKVQDFPKLGRTIRRGFIAAELRRLGAPLTAVASHLGLAPRERVHHARLLTDYLAGVKGPLVVGVDVNEGPEGTASRWISERLFDAFATAGNSDGLTFPAKTPSARIDYLFARDVAQVTASWVSSTTNVRTASDHLPVVADLEIPEE